MIASCVRFTDIPALEGARLEVPPAKHESESRGLWQLLDTALLDF